MIVGAFVFVPVPCTLEAYRCTPFRLFHLPEHPKTPSCDETPPRRLKRHRFSHRDLYHLVAGESHSTDFLPVLRMIKIIRRTRGKRWACRMCATVAGWHFFCLKCHSFSHGDFYPLVAGKSHAMYLFVCFRHNTMHEGTGRRSCDAFNVCRPWCLPLSLYAFAPINTAKFVYLGRYRKHFARHRIVPGEMAANEALNDGRNHPESTPFRPPDHHARETLSHDRLQDTTKSAGFAQRLKFCKV